MEHLSPAARALGALISGTHPAGVLDASLAEAALEHGVGPVVYRSLVDRGHWKAVPSAVQELLARSAREAVVSEPVRRMHLEKVSEELGQEGIRPLVFKGAAVGHSHYPEPWLRTRGDTDLLVRVEDMPRVDAVMTRIGLERFPRPSGSRVTQQARYTIATASIEVAYDVHWRVADPHVFAGVFSYEDLQRESVEGPMAGLRRIGDVHALLVACVHRAAHHGDSDNVRHLYDISLIAKRLTVGEWDRFVAQSTSGEVRAVCRRGLALASELFGSCAPDDVHGRLSTRYPEPSSVFVSRRMNKIALLRSDLRALRTWRDRVALLYEHAMPSSGYMRTAGGRPEGHLPLLYLERLVRGVNAWRSPL
jgi:hypothetical protein